MLALTVGLIFGFVVPVTFFTGVPDLAVFVFVAFGAAVFVVAIDLAGALVTFLGGDTDLPAGMSFFTGAAVLLVVVSVFDGVDLGAE